MNFVGKNKSSPPSNPQTGTNECARRFDERRKRPNHSGTTHSHTTHIPTRTQHPHTNTHWQAMYIRQHPFAFTAITQSHNGVAVVAMSFRNRIIAYERIFDIHRRYIIPIQSEFSGFCSPFGIRSAYLEFMLFAVRRRRWKIF